MTGINIISSVLRLEMTVYIAMSSSVLSDKRVETTLKGSIATWYFLDFAMKILA
jgi:hypothetical protein